MTDLWMYLILFLVPFVCAFMGFLLATIFNILADLSLENTSYCTSEAGWNLVFAIWAGVFVGVGISLTKLVERCGYSRQNSKLLPE
jgi:di/tricarboxylate transporter